MVTHVSIAGRLVGPGQPCFVIAEAGVNHNGDMALARALVDAAAAAGADAVKFQTFRAANIVTREAPQADYQKAHTGIEESQYDMLKRLELTEDAHRELLEYCRARHLLFLSAPFDEESADFLDQLQMAAFKVPSGEITNLPFLAHLARKHKPLIVSTGMANEQEVASAVRAVREENNDQLILLHCVSTYPADPSDANLRAMGTLARAFRVPVGFSDHTLGTEVSLAAVALGACVIEKHFTTDRALPGPDHRASLEPHELSALVKGIRKVESALGHGRKEPVPGEANVASVARKSLVAARSIAAGERLSENMIAVRRPGTGLPPTSRRELIGRRAKVDIPAGALFTREMIE
ncbi:MAG: N-acetylneuraminate synthase [Verrucomicrobiota bacterium]